MIRGPAFIYVGDNEGAPEFLNGGASATDQLSHIAKFGIVEGATFATRMTHKFDQAIDVKP